jgi:hypothetical protein
VRNRATIWIRDSPVHFSRKAVTSQIMGTARMPLLLPEIRAPERQPVFNKFRAPHPWIPSTLRNRAAIHISKAPIRFCRMRPIALPVAPGTRAGEMNLGRAAARATL